MSSVSQLEGFSTNLVKGKKQSNSPIAIIVNDGLAVGHSPGQEEIDAEQAFDDS